MSDDDMKPRVIEYEGGVPKDANGVPITKDSPEGTTAANVVFHTCPHCGTKRSVKDFHDRHVLNCPDGPEA